MFCYLTLKQNLNPNIFPRNRRNCKTARLIGLCKLMSHDVDFLSNMTIKYFLEKIKYASILLIQT